MKKILILLTTLLFASIATAENEAVYDKKAGSVEIPVLSVKGQTDKFSVTLHQQDTENLIFSVTDMEPNPVVNSSTNEATYDPETGTVIIPTVFVLEEGNETVTSYSVELKLTEESTFEVSQSKPVLGLSSNVFNSVQSEPLGFTKSAKAASKWCTGNPNQNIDEARRNFKNKCGEPWNDQKGHVCDYKSDGFHCNGNVSDSGSGASVPAPTPTTPAATSPSSTSNSAWCTGTPDRNIDMAKEEFKKACGQYWNDQLGHVCTRKPDGWHCSGNKTSADQVASVPYAPRFVMARRWHSHVVQISWRRPAAISTLKGYNIEPLAKLINPKSILSSTG